MHNHNNENNQHDSNMMWMMAVCCLAPLVVLLIFGRGLLQSRLGWIIIVFVVAMVAHHFWAMRKHGSQEKNAADSAGQNNTPEDEHEHH